MTERTGNTRADGSAPATEEPHGVRPTGDAEPATTGVRAAADRGCTCFQVRRAARLVTQLYDAELAPAGVSIVHYAVMNVVTRDGELTISSLADRLATDRTTLSRTIERMRAAGLVETQPGSDRRERRLRLTDRGEAVFAEARRLWQGAEDRLVARLGAARLAELRTLLGALEDLAEETDGARAPGA
jgi:DNA-binding MarR family transcriptional regulator